LDQEYKNFDQMQRLRIRKKGCYQQIIAYWDEGGSKESSRRVKDNDRWSFWSDFFWTRCYYIWIFSCSSCTWFSWIADHLKISIREDEKKHTAKLLSLAEQHHLIIVILLLTNAVLCKALPIFMDNLVPTTSVAIILRVVLILFFEEILPSAAPHRTNWNCYEKTITACKLRLVGGEAPTVADRYTCDELSALVRIERMKSKSYRGSTKPVHKYVFNKEKPEHSWRVWRGKWWML
jgi:hypothetical protein